ncbi:unnamed protein product [Caenorhabditis bovis]|uniref:Uncharacterized protein n=1 Tax=Caenorhabditis bovis TaxID=2654633 RepID=A0A8S1EI88_9PELO|nr:unnamed protein product [Caenorhabditis bovis]
MFLSRQGRSDDPRPPREPCKCGCMCCSFRRACICYCCNPVPPRYKARCGHISCVDNSRPRYEKGILPAYEIIIHPPGRYGEISRTIVLDYCTLYGFAPIPEPGTCTCGSPNCKDTGRIRPTLVPTIVEEDETEIDDESEQDTGAEEAIATDTVAEEEEKDNTKVGTMPVEESTTGEEANVGKEAETAEEAKVGEEADIDEKAKIEEKSNTKREAEVEVDIAAEVEIEAGKELKAEDIDSCDEVEMAVEARADDETDFGENDEERIEVEVFLKIVTMEVTPSTSTSGQIDEDITGKDKAVNEKVADEENYSDEGHEAEENAEDDDELKSKI